MSTGARHFRGGLLLAVMATTCLWVSVESALAQKKKSPAYYYRPGYEVEVFRGTWRPRMRIDRMRPWRYQMVTTFAADVKQFTLPAPKNTFTVLSGYLDLRAGGEMWFEPGAGNSRTAVMLINGEEVYRKLPGQKTAIGGRKTPTLLAGGRHRFHIVHFTPVDRFVCNSSIGMLGAAYIRTREKFTPAHEARLVGALKRLADHTAERREMTPGQLHAAVRTVASSGPLFGTTEKIIAAAVRFVEDHDRYHPHLFHDGRVEWTPGQPRTGVRWAVLLTQQYLLDQAFTHDNVNRYRELVGSMRFATSAQFPGKVEPSIAPFAKYDVNIWATFPKTQASMHWPGGEWARKPTGMYLAPGTVATVRVPGAMVKRGFAIRVGGRCNDQAGGPSVSRLFRVSTVYPLNRSQVVIANPLGGSIYVEVPRGAQQGRKTITLSNVVPAPLYTDTGAHRTTAQQWRLDQRRHRAPWAHLQTERVAMQMPRQWAVKLDNPGELLDRWDAAITAAVRALGYDPDEIGREAMCIRSTSLQPTDRGVDRYQLGMAGGLPDVLRGPADAPASVFREWLAAVESPSAIGTNHFAHLAALGWGCGLPMEEAFSRAVDSGNNSHTLRLTAVRQLNLGGYDPEREQADVPRDRTTDLAMYGELVGVIGWEKLAACHRAIVQQRGSAKDHRPIETPRYIEQLCKSTGWDMRPLLHFWGVAVPSDAKENETIEAAVQAGKIRRSAAVFDRLKRYQSWLLNDSKAYHDFASRWYGWDAAPTVATAGEPTDGVDASHRELWSSYTSAAATERRKALQRLIAQYFPGGRPAE